MALQTHWTFPVARCLCASGLAMCIVSKFNNKTLVYLTTLYKPKPQCNAHLVNCAFDQMRCAFGQLCNPNPYANHNAQRVWSKVQIDQMRATSTLNN